MNKNSIILLTKDAFCTEYLPCYGNEYWKGQTPNIDELIAKGTLFTRFYTAAPSSAMAYLAMFTGLYPYEQNVKDYVPLVEYEGETLFDKARKRGLECHVIWDEKWMTTSYVHSMCYGKETIIHPLKNLKQGVGFHYEFDGPIQASKEKEEKTLDIIEEVFNNITQRGSIFLWCHLPHVINGRTGYGSDIDVFDRVVGIARKYFDDSKIYLSGDHGNMNGHRGKLGYGFDVYESAIRIPLITPRKNGLHTFNGLVCNIDWDKIIFGGDVIPSREVVVSDSAYYAQHNRKTVVLYKEYRYIYNKIDCSEELYDIGWDPNQNFNLISDNSYDIDRHVDIRSQELYFYPYWDKLPEIRAFLREKRKSIWREPTKKQVLVSRIRKNRLVRKLAMPIIKLLRKKRQTKNSF